MRRSTAVEVRHRVTDQTGLVAVHSIAIACHRPPSRRPHAESGRPQIVRHIVGDLFHLRTSNASDATRSIEVRFAESSIPFSVLRPAQGGSGLTEAALHDGAAGRVDGFDLPHRTPCDGQRWPPRRARVSTRSPGPRHAVSIFSANLAGGRRYSFHQQMVPSGAVSERRPQQRSVRRAGSAGAREAAPSVGHLSMVDGQTSRLPATDKKRTEGSASRWRHASKRSSAMRCPIVVISPRRPRAGVSFCRIRTPP